MIAKVTRQLAADFATVAKHFHLAELDELEEAKQAVRNDQQNAAISYEIMAREAL